MDDHKSYHDDPPTYEETMAGILPPSVNNSVENDRRRSESNASETSTARLGIQGLVERIVNNLIAWKNLRSLTKTKTKKSRTKCFGFSYNNDSSIILL